MTEAPEHRAPVTVASLVCHRDAAMAVTCLGSLLDCCRQPLRFRIHDDGSLTAADRAEISERLGAVEFIDRKEADARMAARLADFPRCQKMREHEIYALKLFDVPLIGQEENIAYCDSDILFLRPFDGLFTWPDAATGCLFMRDRQEAYSIRPWHLLPGSGICLPRRFNAGFFFLRRSRYDLSVFEDFVARDCPVFQQLGQWLEQTCWAQLAMRIGGRFWNERQISTVRSEASLTPELVAGHFISPVRGLLPAAQGRIRLDLPAVQITTEEMPRLGPLQLGIDTLERYLRTRHPGRFGNC